MMSTFFSEYSTETKDVCGMRMSTTYLPAIDGSQSKQQDLDFDLRHVQRAGLLTRRGIDIIPRVGGGRHGRGERSGMTQKEQKRRGKCETGRGGAGLRLRRHRRRLPCKDELHGSQRMKRMIFGTSYD